MRGPEGGGEGATGGVSASLLHLRLPLQPLTMFKASTCSVSSSSSTSKVKERVWPESSQPARASEFAWVHAWRGQRARASHKLRCPLHPVMCRGGATGRLLAQNTWTGVPLRKNRLGRAGSPRPTPTAPGRLSQPDASPAPYHSATPVFNTEEETVHRDRGRDPQAPDSPSPGSALLVQER